MNKVIVTEIMWNELNDGDEVWACAYMKTNTEKSNLLKQTPVYGIIQNNKFCPYNKQGKIVKSKMVGKSSRHYARTESESKEIYNILVQRQINFLQSLMDECKADLIP